MKNWYILDRLSLVSMFNTFLYFRCGIWSIIWEYLNCNLNADFIYIVDSYSTNSTRNKNVSMSILCYPCSFQSNDLVTLPPSFFVPHRYKILSDNCMIIKCCTKLKSI